MLVPRMHVGLVIGHNGSTIKEITQKSHARIDVRHEFFNRPLHPLRMGNSMVLCQVSCCSTSRSFFCPALVSSPLLARVANIVIITLVLRDR